jgi:hypothetical protein
MKKNIQEFISLVEAQNNSLNFDVDSYINYKDSILNAVLVLFKDKNYDEILNSIQDEVKK